tara:strand:+ start:273 stop:2018 length:1746 start_codon:yes stop_codon:yes gene_type:complete
MIRNVFDRPMFRVPGVDNRPSGIMASGPQLMQASFTPVKPKTFDQTVTEIKDAFSKATTASPLSIIGSAQAAEKDKDLQARFDDTVDPEGPPGEGYADLSKLIQEANKRVLEDEKNPFGDTRKNEPVDDAATLVAEEAADDRKDEPTGDAATLYKRDIPGLTLDKTKQKVKELSGQIQNLYNNYTTDLENLGNRDIFGTTMNEAVDSYRTALGKKPKELNFADVKDDVFEVLGYDRETLDENLSKDQQSAIWLNVMRAGLAVAAGESPNALTNVAKGFGVGLEGYGRDIKDLRDDYREDLEKYTTTAYTMLKDAKAEELAKNTLNLQRAASEFQITSQFFGQERDNLLSQLNREVALRNMKINTLKAFSELEFENQKFDISQDQFEQSQEIAFQKLKMMEDPLIQGAIIDGYVELIDPNKPATSDNLKPTQKFKESNKSLLDILKKQSTTAKLTQSQVAETKYGKAPAFGITYVGDKSKIDDELRDIVGQRINNLAAAGSGYNKALSGEMGALGAGSALAQVISAYDGINDSRVKIDFKKLNPVIQLEIKKGEGSAYEIFKDNINSFIIDSIPQIEERKTN